MVLVDTSSRPEDKANLELACRNADVIILCFDSGLHENLPLPCSIVLESRRVSRASLTGGALAQTYAVPALCSRGTCFYMQEASGSKADGSCRNEGQEEQEVSSCVPCRPSTIIKANQ